METQKILVLAANPKDTSRLRLAEEVREISEGLLRAKQRDHYELTEKWAVRPRDVQRAMLEVRPQIVHFLGHGVRKGEGLVFEDINGSSAIVSSEALASLFELFSKNLDCVVLNACYSEKQAEAIAKHIPYVVGMSKEIGDRAAIEFAVSFYDALGAGEFIEFAYRLGCNAIQLAGIQEHLKPVLKKNSILISQRKEVSNKGVLEDSNDQPQNGPAQGGKVYQQGKYNINILKGEGIHIGDG